jgi:hypothetical protein
VIDSYLVALQMARPRPTGLRRWGLRALLALSLTLGLFWTAGTFLEDLTGREVPSLPFLALSAALVLGGLGRSLVIRPGFLVVPREAPWPRLLLRLAACTLLVYLLFIPLFGLAAHLVVVWAWPDPQHSQAGLYKLLVALWLPLWWAPGLGALWSWKRS